MNTQNDPILDTTQAATLLGVSASFLNKKRCSGGGPRFIKLGSRVGYRLSALRGWQDANTFSNTSEIDLRGSQAA